MGESIYITIVIITLVMCIFVMPIMIMCSASLYHTRLFNNQCVNCGKSLHNYLPGFTRCVDCQK